MELCFGGQLGSLRSEVDWKAVRGASNTHGHIGSDVTATVKLVIETMEQNIDIEYNPRTGCTELVCMDIES